MQKVSSFYIFKNITILLSQVRENYGEEENQGQMVSKEVKNARTFETTFLSFYQLYLSLLDLYLTHKIPSNYSYIAFRDEIVCLQ